MINQPKISIIIPVYGVEEYIEKCIQSLLNQKWSNFEAIIIDDGSLDKSIFIAKKLIGKDPRFVFLEKDNGGQASARNMGLDHATGEYVAFLDSDDYIEPDYLTELFNCLISNSADISCCGINYVDINGNISKTTFTNIVNFHKKKDFLLSKLDVTNFMWDKLFKKEIFAKYRFDTSLRTNEDVHLIFRIIFNKTLANTNKALYNYLQRPGSTSKAVPSTFLQDRIKIKDKHLEFVHEQNLYKAHSDYIIYAYLRTFVFCCATTFAQYSKNYSKDIKALKAEINPQLFTINNILHTIRVEPKIGLALLLFKTSPTLFKLFIRFWFRNTIA